MDFDKTKHMSDNSVSQRDFERKRLITQDNIAAEKLRKKEEEEKKRREEQRYNFYFFLLFPFFFSFINTIRFCYIFIFITGERKKQIR